MEKIFRIKEKGSTTRTEVIAGLTTFLTMIYVLAVQPSAMVGFGGQATFTDVSGAVIHREGLLLLCALVTAGITLLMAFYTNMPLALSTGMGTNFLMGSLLQQGELSFGGIMAIILVSGIVFVVLSLLGIRELIVTIIPKNIKVGISAAIGFFIAYLGFKNSGIADFSAGMALGEITSPAVLVALGSLVLIAALTALHIPGAILIGIIVPTVIGIPLGLTQVPQQIVSMPNFSTVDHLIFNLDFSYVFSSSGFVLMFIAFFGDFFSTLGTVLGVAGKAGFLDKDGNFPEIARPFIVDAIGTCVGALFGCTTITTFVESSSGVEAGGRTGLTAFVTSMLFFLSIFFAPLFLIIPDFATGPALIFVGILMISGLKDIEFSALDDSFGPVIMLLFTVFTSSMANGISLGILAHVLIKLCTGKGKELHPAIYALCIPLIGYFIFK